MNSPDDFTQGVELIVVCALVAMIAWAMLEWL